MKKRSMKPYIIGIIILGFLIATAGISSAKINANTELAITSITGGLGSVTAEIKNLGEVTAEGVTSTISVKGGIFDKINLAHACAGCSACGTTLDPGLTKTENTREAGILFGFGSVTITVTADAQNANEVTETMNGFVLGFLVIV
jgi:hypothetical protein